MADSILKLRVESSEYDQKLKKAAEGIRHLADVAHQGGGELTGLEKAELDYVKALGEMETKSRTAAGSVRELESTYKELKVIYDQLNDVEKADEGGKALAASLEQIKTRAQEARTQLENASKSLNDNGQQAEQSSSALDALASKFTINIDAIKLFNIGLQAAEGALDVAKDAFFNNEEQLDEWGRTVQASEGLYQGFLNALNTGDVSGFLANIGNIVNAAREAYDALDALGTYNAFNQINIERTRTNMTESIADFRGGKGTKEGVKAAGDAYKKELADRQRLENEAYVAAVKEMAAKRGANAKDLMDALSGTYGHYQDLKNVQPSGTRTRYIPGLPGQAGRYEEYKVAQNNQERLGEALRHLNDTELQSLQALGAQAQRTGTEIAQVDKQLTRVLNAKQPGETTKSGKSGKSTKTEQTELQQNQTKINALTQEYVKLGDESTDAVRERQAEIQKEIELLQQRNGLLGKRAEQAQGRLLSNDDIKRKAEIDMQANTKQIEDLRRQIAEIEQSTATVNVDATHSPDFLSFSKGAAKPREAGSRDISTKSVTITATDEALPKLREIEGITIDDKTMTVTAETDDALRALQGIEGVTIDPKSVTITATDEALPKLREIEGITIDDKTMTVTAETDDSLRALQGIEGVTIDPKTIEVNANTSEAQQKIDGLKAKIAELEDKNINIQAFVESIGKPLGEGLNKTPGTLLKAPDTTIPRGGLQLDDKDMKAVRKNIDDSLPKKEKKDSPMDSSKKMLNAISQLTGGLQQMGVELPSEIQGVIGVIQGAMQVIEAVNTIIGVTQTTALTANTAAMISLESALWANTTTSWFHLANGGIVPGFANGGVIDSGHSPSFLSFSKAAPAFATGGVVSQTITSIPKFATGGTIQKFATGGTVEAGHAPDFLSFSKAMPKFTTGGTIPHANSGYFVGGTHFSGDVTPIMANAGELVLNKAQQGNLASQLQGGGMQNLNLTATIKGEQIRLALNNNGRRTGRGEYVQSSNRV